MARKSKSITLNTEDLVFGFLGGLAGLAANGLANQALANQPENTRQTVGKALPFVKMAGGGYVAMNKTMDRRARFFGLGVGVTGGIEAGIKFAPQYFAIGTADGSDVFSLIGNTDVVNIPVIPAAGAQETKLFEEEAVMGVDDYSNLPVL